MAETLDSEPSLCTSMVKCAYYCHLAAHLLHCHGVRRGRCRATSLLNVAQDSGHYDCGSTLMLDWLLDDEGVLRSVAVQLRSSSEIQKQASTQYNAYLEVTPCSVILVLMD